MEGLGEDSVILRLAYNISIAESARAGTRRAVNLWRFTMSDFARSGNQEGVEDLLPDDEAAASVLNGDEDKIERIRAEVAAQSSAPAREETQKH